MTPTAEVPIEKIYIDLGDGRKREIRSNLRSARLIQSLYRKLPEDATDQEKERVITENFEAILHAMLVGADRDISVEDVGDMPDALLPEVSEAVKCALLAGKSEERQTP